MARRASRALVRDRSEGRVLDDGLVLWFPAPASFTGEDVAELHLHGGRAVVRAVLDALGAQPGLRIAAPGEFSRRAFVNGRMDLTAAEGLADLIDAETEAQRRQAMRQMQGALGALYESWRARLVAALAHLEAVFDFSDDELPDDLTDNVAREVAALAGELAAHLDDDHRGERLRGGLSVAIIGPPNVGKSSLINALAKRDVAIVDASAGTTRDVIEVHLDLGGLPVTVADTAGLRAARGPVEGEGVRRARARAAAADLVVELRDIRDPHTVIDAEGGPVLVVCNKADLATAADLGALGSDRLAISCRTGAGLDRLVARLKELLAERFEAVAETPLLTRARHREAVRDCVEALKRFEKAPSPELAAEDLRHAATALGRITGRVDVEDILDRIFADFCIGK